MVQFPNLLTLLTKPVTNIRDKVVGDAIRGGVSRAAKDIGGEFMASMTKGLENIGQFAGNHKKELALGAGAVAALGIAKQLFWTSNTPIPPPPPSMVENITNFLQNNWKVAAPVAAAMGVAAPLLLQRFSQASAAPQYNAAASVSQPPNDIMNMMMKGVNNIQNGHQTGQGNPFLDFNPNIDLSDVSGNGHNIVPEANSSDKDKATAYMNYRLNQIYNS